MEYLFVHRIHQIHHTLPPPSTLLCSLSPYLFLLLTTTTTKHITYMHIHHIITASPLPDKHKKKIIYRMRAFLLISCLLLTFLQASLSFLLPSPPAAQAHTRPSSRLFSSPNYDEAAVRKEAADKIQQLVNENKIMLFMKGSKLFPQCGFSNTAVSILRAVDAEFETFDVLSDMIVREEIKTFSAWPTIPQCYINGEFVGGSDILLQMYESGELENILADMKK